MLNLASRLCDTAEAGQIMLTQRVYADVEDLAEVEPFGDLDLKGFAKPVPTLNLLALKEGATGCGPHKAGRPERGRIIRKEQDGVRVLVDLKKGDKADAIRAIEDVLSQLKG